MRAKSCQICWIRLKLRLSKSPVMAFLLAVLIGFCLISTGECLFLPDPLCERSTQSHPRRGQIGQILTEACCLQRLRQVGMCNAHPRQPPEDGVVDERKLRCRFLDTAETAESRVILHNHSSFD